jgi:hypothetical protein
MRRAILGIIVGAALVTAAVALLSQRDEVLAQRVAAAPAGSGDLIAMPLSSGDKGQLLTVIDPRLQTIGVYAIDPASGKISLRSVRNIHWDLQMSDFNGENPLPKEIRLQLDQR